MPIGTIYIILYAILLYTGIIYARNRKTPFYLMCSAMYIYIRQKKERAKVKSLPNIYPMHIYSSGASGTSDIIKTTRFEDLYNI